MKKIFLFIILFSIFILSACSDKNEKNDFNFTLNFGYGDGLNFVDTYNDIFIKDLGYNETEKITFKIPDDKKQEFYEMFLEYEIYDLPEKLLHYNYSDPPYNYSLAYSHKQETKTIVCNDWWEEPYDSLNFEKYTKFIEFVNTIRDYIFSTEEYKNMSPDKGGYDYSVFY